MTKNEQLKIDDVLENLHATIFVEYLAQHRCIGRLRSCQATVYETKNHYVLKSYATVVAAINKSDGKAYDFLRLVYGYTATSAQHISKFFHDFGAKERYTWRDV